MKIIPNWPNDDGHMPTRNSKETVLLHLMTWSAFLLIETQIEFFTTFGFDRYSSSCREMGMKWKLAKFHLVIVNVTSAGESSSSFLFVVEAK